MVLTDTKNQIHKANDVIPISVANMQTTKKQIIVGRMVGKCKIQDSIT